MKMIGFRGGMGEFLTGRTWCDVVPPANLLFPQRKLMAAAWTGFSNDPSCVTFNKSLRQDGCYWGHCIPNTCLQLLPPTHAAAAPEPHVTPVISGVFFVKNFGFCCCSIFFYLYLTISV
jgi:hypothetical protein